MKGLAAPSGRGGSLRIVTRIGIVATGPTALLAEVPQEVGVVVGSDRAAPCRRCILLRFEGAPHQIGHPTATTNAIT